MVNKLKIQIPVFVLLAEVMVKWFAYYKCFTKDKSKN